MKRKIEMGKQTAEQIKGLQEVKLRETIAYVNEYSPFYRQMFASNGIDPSSIQTLDDLRKIPFSTKDDLQRENARFFCVPKKKIIDYVTTSGTLGEPVTLVLTEKDLERLALNECESLRCAGGSAAETYQLMTTIDRRFMAGLAYFLGARKLGAGIVRTGNGIPELQWDTIRRIEPTALIVVPSFLLKLSEYALAHGIDPRTTSVKRAICIGEPIRNADFSLNTLGEKIKQAWGIELYSTYASTEMGAAFTECEAGKGGHYQPDLLIAELIGEDGQSVGKGEAGELVITTLGVEGTPLIRFRTGDVCIAHSEPCSCGRSSMRLGPILGRKKQMIKYKGTSLYPPALYDVLNTIPQVKNFIVEVSTNSIGTDDILIRIGCTMPDSNLEKEIADHFRARLRVAPAIRFERPEDIQKEQLPELSRKPIVFIDKRTVPAA
ncbi:MAG TPA: AMP-binding protein [Bacteroidia bacterium]|nr:AMP-binding protein [Bacteroidia bacterium]